MIGKYPFWYDKVDDIAPTLTATGENLNTSPMRSNALPYIHAMLLPKLLVPEENGRTETIVSSSAYPSVNEIGHLM